MPVEEQRPTIFISHATHEDDYQAGWLAAKLRSLGYKVFVDLDDLAGGDTFTTRIQPVIQNESAVFLALTTKAYVEKARDDRSGVRKELNAASVTDVQNFIVPLRFDDIPFHKFPMDYVQCKAFDFHRKFGEGLAELVEDLRDKRGVKPSVDSQTPLSIWHKAIGQRTSRTDVPEQVITTWYPIALPSSLYVHRPYTMPAGRDLNLITYRRHGDHIVTFAPLAKGIQGVKLLKSHSYLTADVVSAGALSDTDYGRIEKPRNYITTLLNKSMDRHMAFCGMKSIGLANKKRIYYIPFVQDEPVRMSLRDHGQNWIQMNGWKGEHRWHFALSCSASLHPVPHYRFFFHVIFTDKVGNTLDDATEHGLRRGFSGELYNRKVLNLFMGMIDFMRITANSEAVELHVDEQDFYQMSLAPLSVATEVGYVEP